MTSVMDRPTASLPPGGVPEIDLSRQRNWRSTKSALMVGLMGVAFLIVLIPLVAVMYTLISKGASIVFADFPAWFTKRIPVVSRSKGPGMGPAIVGTLIITLAASVMAIPLGILGAVYLNEYGKSSPWAKVVRFLSNVMVGVPSIVMGLFVYVVFTLRFGLTGLGGAIALACLMLPVVIRATEEMLRLVPDNLREASYALGTRKSRTILTVVLPSALPGVVSGALLAVARAAGETAPLIFTIGLITKTNTNVFSGPNTTLSRQIFANALSPLDGPKERAWGAALTLVVLTFLLTVIARIVTSVYQRRRG